MCLQALKPIQDPAVVNVFSPLAIVQAAQSHKNDFDPCRNDCNCSISKTALPGTCIGTAPQLNIHHLTWPSRQHISATLRHFSPFLGQHCASRITAPLGLRLVRFIIRLLLPRPQAPAAWPPLSPRQTASAGVAPPGTLRWRAGAPAWRTCISRTTQSHRLSATPWRTAPPQPAGGRRGSHAQSGTPSPPSPACQPRRAAAAASSPWRTQSRVGSASRAESHEPRHTPSRLSSLWWRGPPWSIPTESASRIAARASPSRTLRALCPPARGCGRRPIAPARARRRVAAPPPSPRRACS
mmetsp:Transcript_37059/g.93631  ORF Transcript_37059/g.93631 Transcript_37059/m.93631 type:complete len:297 (+) Transcript_37059:77-967(+)